MYISVKGIPDPLLVDNVISTYNSCYSQLFPDYLEVTTAVVVPRGVGKTSPYIDIVLILIRPLGILSSDGEQNTSKAGARGSENCCTFH